MIHRVNLFDSEVDQSRTIRLYEGITGHQGPRSELRSREKEEEEESRGERREETSWKERRWCG